MGLIFKAWGLDGSLSAFTDFADWNGNGVQDATANVDAAVVGDRADIVSVDGFPAIRLTYYEDDALAGFGRRTELVPSDRAQMIDWVGDGEAGADANDSIRQYRVKVRLPEDFDIDSIDDSADQMIVFQIHQTSDDSPEDTEGLSPTLALHIRKNTYPRNSWRYCLIRNVDTDQTVTVFDASTQQQEVASWLCVPGRWEDIHVSVQWSFSSLGQCRIYRNRRPVFVSVDAANCPNDAPSRGGGGQYAKIGVYTNINRTWSVEHRGLIVGDHEATFADMYPELDGAVPLERVTGPSDTCIHG